MKTRSAAGADAFQECLALEYEALYAFALIGGRLKAGTTVQERASASYRRHRGRREAILALLGKAGADPVQPSPTYPMPEVSDDSTATTLAQDIEGRSTAAYLRLVGATDTDDRAFAVMSLSLSATDGLGWGIKPAALPGTYTQEST